MFSRLSSLKCQRMFPLKLVSSWLVMPIKLPEWRLFMSSCWYVFVLLMNGFLSSSEEMHGKRAANSTSFSSSWAIRIPVEHYVNMSDLHALADHIANEAGLVNRGQIGGLLGHYLYVHDTFFNQSGIKRHELNKVQGTITEHLANHPKIEWSRQEMVRMRYKRSLQFKDQYFPSQWHLVRTDLTNHY